MKINNKTEKRKKQNKLSEAWHQWDVAWHQWDVVHCPNHGCKGMLLQNALFDHELCTDCNRRWERVVSYKEVFDR